MAGNKNSGRRSRPHNLQLLEGRGNGKDAAGRPIPEPPPFTREAPECPEHLTGYARELWERIVPQLDNLKLLKDLDGPSLEMACETYAMWREAVDKRKSIGMIGKGAIKGTVVIAPWVRIEISAGKEFRSWCREYGLTPSAEMSLATPGSNPEDPHAGNPFAGTGS